LKIKSSFVFALAMLFALALTSVASASTLNLTALPSQTYNGFYVGLVPCNVNGVSSLCYCDDFRDRTNPPTSFAVNIETIANLAGAYYYPSPTSVPSAQTEYKEASILAYEMMLPGNSGDIGGIQFALWHIFDSATPQPGNSATWLAWVQGQNLAAYNYSGVRIYTPLDSPNQEFLTPATPAAIPEPVSFYLLLSGVALIGLGHLRRRAHAR
jgi:hypothetical protein